MAKQRRVAERERAESPLTRTSEWAVVDGRASERDELSRTIATILERWPSRRSASRAEQEALDWVEGRLRELGLSTDRHGFRFSTNLYAVLALHFGLGTLGTLVGGRAPALGLALHGLAGLSYLADSTRSAYVLRRLLPWRASTNLVATLPSEGPRRLRLVYVSHIDAALTGLLFDPRMMGATGFEPSELERPGLLRRGLALATGTQLALAGVDVLRLAGVLPSTGPVRALEAALTVPSLIAAVLNLDVVLRDTVVPGANDNLSGVAGCMALAQRFLARPTPGVEHVFVVTGCEEAGTGGAWALARDMAAHWDPAETIVLAVDGLAGGELHYMTEGEVIPHRLDAGLEEELEALRRADARFSDVRRLQIPVGATDAYPFLRRGYRGVGIGCADRRIGAPRHYHLPTDTLDRMEIGDVQHAVDYTEVLARRLAARYAGGSSEPAPRGP